MLCGHLMLFGVIGELGGEQRMGLVAEEEGGGCLCRGVAGQVDG